MPKACSDSEGFSVPEMFSLTPISGGISKVTIKGAASQMFLCRPWDGVLLWANRVSDRYLPYGDMDCGGRFVSLNYCLRGRCEVRLPSGSYVYMGPDILCVDDHRPTDGYWYLGQSYTGLEVVFDMGKLPGRTELTAYCDCGGWIKEMLEGHDGTYLATVNSDCRRLMELLYTRLCAADWQPRDYRMHLLLLLYGLVNGGTIPIRERFYVTKGQKRIASDVEKRLTGNLSRHYTIAEMAAKYGVNPSALKKYFQAVYGQHISGYLRQKRMELAKRLLAEGTESVAGIAAACGYVNQGKFGAVFRECTGMSPLEYRRLNYHEREEGCK